MSLPTRGAWIEMPYSPQRKNRSLGRSPHGERGLKSLRVAIVCKSPGRSPHGERGLKFSHELFPVLPGKSLPTRGAWIEIDSNFQRSLAKGCRSPHGERGLKLLSPIILFISCLSLPTRGAWIEITFYNSVFRRATVAPHTGSVD